MKIYLETRFGGGSGGEERLLENILKTKPEHVEIDLNVIVNNQLKIGDIPENISLVDYANKNYDYGIRLGLLGDKRDYLKGDFKKTILNPCEYHFLNNGRYNKEIYKYYDIIWKETPQSMDKELNKEIFICPPIFLKYEELKNNKIVDQIKGEKFYVTVANYYDINMKGIDLIYKFAETSKYPIIWFNSDTKTYCEFPKFKKPENLKIARNIRHSTILDTVAKSEAYICFSRSEGFGFAISEAVMLNKPIVTKKVGLVKYFPEDFNLFDDVSEINNINFKNVNYDKYHKLFREDFWEKLLK